MMTMGMMSKFMDSTDVKKPVPSFPWTQGSQMIQQTHTKVYLSAMWNQLHIFEMMHASSPGKEVYNTLLITVS